MKAFYKILDNGKAESGTTLKDKVPDGYIEFTLGEEPQELIEAKAFKTTDELIVDAKEAKAKALDELTVTTANGNVFDADDASRANMNEAITASWILDLTEHNWKLADNSIKLIQIDELKEALSLGIQAKGAIVLG